MYYELECGSKLIIWEKGQLIIYEKGWKKCNVLHLRKSIKREKTRQTGVKSWDTNRWLLEDQTDK